MYEGRTRGKKLKYTYSDDEDVFSDDQPSTRRSTRNAASSEIPIETRPPRFTASGRQIRSRAGGLYGEALLSGQREGTEDEDFDDDEVSRPQRTRTATHPNGYSGYGEDDLEDASEVHSNADDSGNEWRGVEDDLEHDFEGDDEEEASGDESIGNEEPVSLVVQLRYGKGDASSHPVVQVDKPPPANDVEMKEAGQTTATPSGQEIQTALPRESDLGVQQTPILTPSSDARSQGSAEPAPVLPVSSVPSPQVSQEGGAQRPLNDNPGAPGASHQTETNGV